MLAAFAVVAAYLAGFYSGAAAFVWYLKSQYPDVCAALVQQIKEREKRRHADKVR